MQLKKFSEAAQKVLIQCQKFAQKNRNLLIEPEHLAQALLMTPELTELLSKKNVEHKELLQELNHLIANLPVGVSLAPHFSSRLIQALSSAEALSISKRHDNIFVSDLFLSLLENKDKYGALGGLLAKYFLDQDNKPEMPKNDIFDTKVGLFSLDDNINYLVKNDKLDPSIGREEEISRLIQILSRKSRNNPILIGEPGVGRTSIVYGLAKRIVEQKIPSHLVGKEIIALDVSSLVSGTTLRGQFEERIQKLAKELSNHLGHYILFVRDLGMLMGAGGEGASDAANLLKPSLSRGIIQLIGLVTPEVYKKRIEADPSFERHFQPVWINPPSQQECGEILFGLKDKYEQFHGVFIDDEAVTAAIELGARHVTGRVLPLLALDILDEACSRHRVSIDQEPEAILDLKRRIVDLEIKQKDKNAPSKTTASLEKLRAALAKKSAQRERELSIIETMRALKGELFDLGRHVSKEISKGDLAEAADLTNIVAKDLRDKFEKARRELTSIKKSERFIDPWVKRDDIAAVVSQETGIPTEKMLQSEREKLLHMEDVLSTSVIGQKEAIKAVSDAIRRARVGLKDPKRPIGSFLFLGPTGVGKTETARSLTNFLFDDERAMVRFDMSEFMERHTVARLIGAPPGYQGSEEGGQLTERVRRKPYSVVLFDEIEKAHADVLNVLLQVLDEGRLTDSLGNLVNFSNTVIIMTSNIGAEALLRDAHHDDRDALRREIMDRLTSHLRPEFINRIDEIVIFNAIDHEGIVGIAELMLNNVNRRLESEGFTLNVDGAVKDFLVQEGYSREFGARPLKRAIQRLIENPLAMAIVKGDLKKGDVINAVLTKSGQIEFLRERSER